MRFDLYIPCEQLRPYIRHFAISEMEEADNYKILPDTGVVIGFQYRGRLSYLSGDKSIPLSTAGITGINDRYRIFQNTTNVASLLVFFVEGGAAAFFRQPIHELFRQSVSLDDFMLRSELLLIEEQLYEAEADQDRIQVAERFLLSRLKPFVPDQMILSTLRMIYQSRGSIRIADIATMLHTSQSVLEKKFRSIVGTTPKKFASIVRFRHVLHSYVPQTSLTDLGYESGFYDQAHFIREFKAFSGDTPEIFFKK